MIERWFGMWFVFVIEDAVETQVNPVPFNAYQVAEVLASLGELTFLLRPAL